MDKNFRIINAFVYTNSIKIDGGSYSIGKKSLEASLFFKHELKDKLGLLKVNAQKDNVDDNKRNGYQTLRNIHSILCLFFFSDSGLHHELENIKQFLGNFEYKDKLMSDVNAFEDFMNKVRPFIKEQFREIEINLNPKSWKFEVEIEKKSTVQNSFDADSLPLNKKVSDSPINSFKPKKLKIVGRKKELEHITETLNQVRTSGIGKLILIKGSSGVGKSYLAKKSANIAHQLGFQIGLSACEPFQNGISLFPIQEVILQLIEGENLIKSVEKYYSGNSPQVRMAKTSIDHTLEPNQRRDASLATFANALFGRFNEQNSNKTPLFILIDDLEWIDRDTFDAILCCKARFDTGAVVLLGTIRSDIVQNFEENHPAVALLESAQRDANCEIINLNNFEEEVTEELIETILNGETRFPKSFVHRLYTESEGNPLFLRELINCLSGNVHNSSEYPIIKLDSYWILNKSIKKISIPDSIENAVLTRLKNLDKSMRLQLEKASIIGRSFTMSLISYLSNSSEEELMEHLESFIDTHLIRELDEDEVVFEFTHGKIRDVLYKNIPSFKRSRMHAHIAEALMAITETSGQNFDLSIGFHLFNAKKYEACIPYILKSARMAYETYQFSLATELYENIFTADNKTSSSFLKNKDPIRIEYARALRYTGQYYQAFKELQEIEKANLEETERGFLLNELGDLSWLSGNMEDAYTYYKECLELAKSIKNDELIMEVSADLCEYYDRESERLAGINTIESGNKRLESDKYLNIQVELSEKLKDTNGLSRAYRNLAKKKRREFHLEEAISLYEKALSFIGSNSFDHKIYISYAKTVRLTGDYDKALSIVENVIEWSVQTGKKRTEAIGRQYRGLILNEFSSDNSKASAEKELSIALDIHNSISYNRGIRESSMILGEIHAKNKNWEDATKFFRISTGKTKDEFARLAKIIKEQLIMMHEHKRSLQIDEYVDQYEKSK
ncbi:MAG: AAA family ATPase [Flavobacteriales bacterium]|nr:AAA family ATPase [Flavobacteriales bacterium]